MAIWDMLFDVVLEGKQDANENLNDCYLFKKNLFDQSFDQDAISNRIVK